MRDAGAPSKLERSTWHGCQENHLHNDRRSFDRHRNAASLRPCNVEGGTEWVYEKMLKGERFAARVDKHGVTVALAVLTGIGDGCYRTVVRYEDSPVFGRRIAEVKIQFLWRGHRMISRRVPSFPAGWGHGLM
jgi:hypothetical protein